MSPTERTIDGSVCADGLEQRDVKIGCRLVVYGKAPGLGWEVGNLGDIIQTVALARWLPPALGVLRSPGEPKVTDVPFVVNGFFEKPREDQGDNVLFAGIHIDLDPKALVDVEAFLPWFRSSRYPQIGVRDPATKHRLWQYGLNVEMIGCSALTFDRYEGPRSGIYAIDCSAPGEPLSHIIPVDMSLADRWKLAVLRLGLYKTAELVYTSKMHATLPCLAMGTPVCYVPEGIYDASRLSLLDDLGVRPREVTTLDVAPARSRFLDFLRRHLPVTSETPTDPVKPISYEEYRSR